MADPFSPEAPAASDRTPANIDRGFSDDTRGKLLGEYLAQAVEKQAAKPAGDAAQDASGSQTRTEESRSLHFKFKGEYNGNTLEKLTISTPNGRGPKTEITRNQDGTYTIEHQDGSKQQLKNVKYDSRSNMVTYEDESGRELILQKGDQIYKDGLRRSLPKASDAHATRLPLRLRLYLYT